MSIWTNAFELEKDNDTWHHYYKTFDLGEKNEIGKILLRMLTNGNTRFVIKLTRELDVD